MARYGADPNDSSRPVRSHIQNFVEFNIDGNKLTGIVYEIDQNINDGEPYVLDSFGIIQNTEGIADELPRTGDTSMGLIYAIGIFISAYGIIHFKKKEMN